MIPGIPKLYDPLRASLVMQILHNLGQQMSLPQLKMI